MFQKIRLWIEFWLAIYAAPALLVRSASVLHGMKKALWNSGCGDQGHPRYCNGLRLQLQSMSLWKWDPHSLSAIIISVEFISLCVSRMQYGNFVHILWAPFPMYWCLTGSPWILRHNTPTTRSAKEGAQALVTPGTDVLHHYNWVLLVKQLHGVVAWRWKWQNSALSIYAAHRDEANAQQLNDKMDNSPRTLFLLLFRTAAERPIGQPLDGPFKK